SGQPRLPRRGARAGARSAPRAARQPAGGDRARIPGGPHAVGDLDPAGAAPRHRQDPHAPRHGAPPGGSGSARMSHAPYDELVAGYALGALDGEDRERFDAHLAAGCGTCSRAILEYQETLAQAAAELAEAPPARVRTALLARLEPAVRPVPSRRPAATALRWAAGLALAA